MAAPAAKVCAGETERHSETAADDRQRHDAEKGIGGIVEIGNAEHQLGAAGLVEYRIRAYCAHRIPFGRTGLGQSVAERRELAGTSDHDSENLPGRLTGSSKTMAS